MANEPPFGANGDWERHKLFVMRKLDEIAEEVRNAHQKQNEIINHVSNQRLINALLTFVTAAAVSAAVRYFT